MTAAALFDWDGTLLDSREPLLGAWYASTEELLGRRFPASLEDEERVFTLGGATLFPELMGGEEAAEQLASVFQREYQARAEQVRAFPGVVDLLGELRAAGVAIAVVTSKSHLRYDIDARQIGVDGLIDAPICQEDCSAHKPDPAPVLLALERLAVPAVDAVMVGDTPVDWQAAQSAGVKFIGVSWGGMFSDEALRGAGAETLAGDPRELRDLLLPERAEAARR